MPKKNRLSGSQIRSIRSPRRVHSGLCSLVVSQGGSSAARFACVVSKKVASKATDRNSLKRRCRAIVAPELPRLQPGAYVLHAKRDAARASFKDLQRDIHDLLEPFRGARARAQVQ